MSLLPKEGVASDPLAARGHVPAPAASLQVNYPPVLPLLGRAGPVVEAPRSAVVTLQLLGLVVAVPVQVQAHRG